MKSLIIYDSIHGNTREIAETIFEALGSEARLLQASEARLSDVESAKLLIVGSPTYGGRPTPAMQAFLKSLETISLESVKCACFDTRLPAGWVKLFGFAAGKIERSLKKKGAKPVIGRTGFYVKGTKGPLDESEYRHAREWVRNIRAALEK